MVDDGLSNIYIDHVMKKVSKIFLGCYAADNLPSKVMQPYSLIVNLSESSEMGSHFVAIYQQNGKIFYADSFAIPCFVKNICNFIKKQNAICYENQTQIQAFKSNFCGFYAIAFCLWMELNENNLNKFGQLFSRNLYENDYICINLIKKCINQMCN